MAEKSGELQKLKIECFLDEKYKQPVEDGDFVVMFNPNKYALHYEIEYGQRQPSGTSANAPSFSNIKSQELSLEFFIDGTGVTTGQAEDVQQKVDNFLDKAYTYDGKIHRNRYLRIIWGTLVFDCVLKSADITYTLFNSSGKPLRATINGKFLGFVNDELRERTMDKTSPDLTHVRTVPGRDRLDHMTYQIYKTPDYYIDVAQANNLTTFRKLKTGAQLVFPPVVKAKS
jgi:hypothetical protein